jgi:membrane fusion protein (multidrug efflux system)
VQPGEFIKEDTPVITLVVMDPLRLSTAAQEKYAGVMKPGMLVQFTVESYPKEMFRGRIVSVSPAVDQATRTFTVEAELPNRDHRLKPGFFAKGDILTHMDDKVIAAPCPRSPASRRCLSSTRARSIRRTSRSAGTMEI